MSKNIELIREIYYALNFISVKCKISSGKIYLYIDFLVSPQVIFESILYCKINNIPMKSLKLDEEIEIYKYICNYYNKRNENADDQLYHNAREVDLTNNEFVSIFVFYYKTISCQLKIMNLKM